jgi:hypothetical protein
MVAQHGWAQGRAVVLAVVLAVLGACSSAASPPGSTADRDAAPATGGAGSGGSGGSAAASGGAGGTSMGGGATGTSASSDAADAPVADGREAASPDVGAAWPAVIDYAARGPFTITHETNTGPGGTYDIFRPAQLGAERPHPIISWANGTLFDIPDYQKLLEHWASHGFVVICAQTNTTAGGATHKAGIDWLVAENARAGSAYRGVLDPTKIGAAGHSQGGGATIAAGSNKPGPTGIVATLPLMPLLSFEADKTIVTRQLAPMLNINASMDNRDPGGAVANQIFAGAQRGLVQATYSGIHEDAMNAAMLRPTLAWFRLHLMDDQNARALFYPAGTCSLCQDAAWKEVRYKNPP